jgi:serine/threonine protein kinase/Tol biopolymer transport system component
MGEVYRAKDTRVDRAVALKVLPEEFFESEERRGRFEREARMLASLNHSGIAVLYSFEEIPSPSSSRHLLVMELVEGDDLARRISSGPLPLDESFSFARQIAEALEAAHEKGIVHRDLKPANVKVTPDGRVKLLDFGLATIFEGDGDPSRAGSGAGVTESPTLAARGTAAGMILGTAAYMSPEQARGKPVDKRTDVWAFGCVLYEMLTGKRAFDGETVSDVLAAVLMKDVDWAALPEQTPASVRKILRRCLQRDARLRLHDIADARLDLEDLSAAASSSSSGQSPFEEKTGSPGPTPGRSASAVSTSGRKTSLRLSWALAALFAVVAGWTTLRGRPAAAPARALRVAVLPPAGTISSGPFELSPDGLQIAFTAADPGGRSTLYVRSLDSLEARALPGTEDAESPFFSPDGRSLGFFAGKRMKRIDLGGGPPRELASAPDHRGGSWGSKNVIVFAPEGGGPLFQIPSSGGTAVPVTTLDKAVKEVSHRWPHFLPDGRRFLFMSRKPSARIRLAIEVASIDGGPRTKVADANTSGVFARGRLYFVRGTSLLAQAFDTASLAVSGDPAPVAEDVWRSPNTDGLTAFSVAGDGTVAWRRGGIARNQLTWLDRQGQRLGTVGAPAIIGSAALFPDGRRVLAEVVDPDPASDSSGLFVLDAATGMTTRVTFGAGDQTAGLYSPDGRTIVYSSELRGAFDLYRQEVGASDPQPLLTSSVWKFAESWSPDGRFLSYAQSEPGKPRDVWILPMTGDARPFPFAQTAAEEWGSEFSADGRFIAYVSDESGTPEVYVRPFPAAGGKWQISAGGGTSPAWRRDGKELFYLSPDRKLVAVPITLSARGLEAGTARVLFQNASLPLASISTKTPYRAAPDGQRFLANLQTGLQESSPIVLQTGAAP